MEDQVMAAVHSGTLEVDSEGRVWRVKKRGWDRWKQEAVDRPCKRVRAENRTNLGYLQLRLMMDGVRAHVMAHRIVYRVKCGEIPPELTINHKNGIKNDNRPENLEVVTYSENMKHAYRTGLKDEYGEKNPQSKLTTSEVVEIRRLYAKGETTQAQLAAKYSVTFQTISDIVRGERRTTEPGPVADYTHRRQHTNHSRNPKGQFTSLT